MSKRKVLLCNQMHYALTGYGTYGNEILKRLYNNPNFEIAEFAFDAKLEDKEVKQCPWKIYCCAVDQKDPRHPEYKSHPTNARGAWRLERVLIDYRPDIVLTIEDIWYEKVIADSPLRPYFHLVCCPTIDSIPTKDIYIEMLENADACFGWSKFGLDSVKAQSSKINTIKPLWSGVDLEEFKPVTDKRQLRAKFGIDRDINLVGMVSRNQQRKLYPDLFKAFRQFLELAVKSGRKDIADKTFLYIHTSYPDNGWDIPEILLEHDIAHKVLFTYVCEKTKQIYISFFQDGLAVNPLTNTETLNLPSVRNGATREQLAAIYNLMDCYVQYSSNEGLGLGAIEAMCCGVPIFATDYSAMSDLLDMSGGIPVKADRLWFSHNTSAYRAYPDNSDFAQKLLSFFSAKDEYRQKLSDKARKVAEQYFDWNKIAADWAEYFISAKLTRLQGRWDSPINLLNIPQEVPNFSSNSDFVEWLYYDILKYDSSKKYEVLQALQDLNYGLEIDPKNKKTKMTKQLMFKSVINKVKEHNYFERMRCGIIPVPREDYIDFANRNNI